MEPIHIMSLIAFVGFFTGAVAFAALVQDSKKKHIMNTFIKAEIIKAKELSDDIDKLNKTELKDKVIQITNRTVIELKELQARLA